MFSLFKKKPPTLIIASEDQLRRRRILTAERVRMMEELGFETSFTETGDAFNWNRHFELMLELRTRIEKLEEKKQ